MVWTVFSIGVALIVLAIVIWLINHSNQMRAESGVPAGNIIYTDTGTWFANDGPLYAHDVQLVGKPDYLVEQPDGMIIPVELKSGKAPEEPWDGHLYQLAAYCFLVESHYGIRPDHGIIQYQDRAFAVDYTEALEDELLDILTNMREDIRQPTVNRSHQRPYLCARCGVRDACNQRLDR